MSEPTVEATATEAPDQEQPAQPDKPKPTDTLEFWKQKAREQENRAKANADKAKAHDEFVESQKSEQQRLADAAAKVQRERDDARSEALRYKAAATFHVDPDHFDLLGSGNEDEIMARAERLGSLLTASEELVQVKAELEALKQGRTTPSARPVEQLRPGATPSAVAVADDAYPSTWLPSRRTQT